MFKDFETIFWIFAVLLNTISFDFWLDSLFFSVMTSWFPFCCLKQPFLKPVSKFWDLQNLSTFQIFLFLGNSDAVFSLVCLSSCWEVTRISLAFAQNKTRPRPPGNTKLAYSCSLLILWPDLRSDRFNCPHDVIFLSVCNKVKSV